MRRLANMLLLAAAASCAPPTPSTPASASAAAPAHAHDVPAHYEERRVAGFTVLVHEAVLAHPAEAAAVTARLDASLTEVRSLLGPRVRPLEAVRIWVEWKSADRRPRGAAEFHPSRAWLVANGYDPAKEHGVEINDARGFLTATGFDQPFALLHELAHAYDLLALGGEDAGISAAYAQALASGRYASVQRLGGQTERAYAITNAQEYFAESTEAYLGMNDWFPFTREQLRAHDPAGYALMERVWGPPPERPPLALRGCASAGASSHGGVATAVVVSNATQRPLDLVWLDPSGARAPRGTLPPGATNVWTTFEGHAWMVAETGGGPCVATFIAGPRPAQARLAPPPAPPP